MFKMASFSYLLPSLLVFYPLCRGFASLGIHKLSDLNLGWLWRLGFRFVASAFGGISGWWLFLFVGWFLLFGVTLVLPFPFRLLGPSPLP